MFIFASHMDALIPLLIGTLAIAAICLAASFIAAWLGHWSALVFAFPLYFWGLMGLLNILAQMTSGSMPDITDICILVAVLGSSVSSTTLWLIRRQRNRPAAGGFPVIQSDPDSRRI